MKFLTTTGYSSYLKGLTKLIDEFEGKELLENKFVSNESLIDLEKKENMHKSTTSLNNNLRIIKEDEKGEEKLEEKTKRKKGFRPLSPPANQNKPISSPRNNEDLKKTEGMLDAYYNNLGHDYYTRILKIYEKYCHHGKVNQSIGMDYSQFSTFMQHVS